MENKSAQRLFLVNVAGIEGTFATFRGAETTSEVTRDYDGGSKRPDILAGPPATSDVRVGRGWRRRRDIAVVKKYRPQVGSWRTVVTLQELDENLVKVGAPERHSGLLVGLTPREVDANSSAVARLEMTFAIEDIN